MKSRQSGNIVIGLIVGLVLGLGIALGVAVYVTKVPIPFLTKTQRGGAEQDEAEARRNRDWDPNGPLAGRNGANRNNPAVPAPPPPTQGSGSSSNPFATGAQPGGTASAPVPTVVPPTAQNPRVPRTAPIPAEVSPGNSNDPLGDLARSRTGGAPASQPNVAIAPQTSSPPPSASTDPFVYFVQAGAFRSNDDAQAQRARLSLLGIDARITEREQAGRTVYRVRVGPFDRRGDADRLKDRLDSGGMEAALVRVQR